MDNKTEQYNMKLTMCTMAADSGELIRPLTGLFLFLLGVIPPCSQVKKLVGEPV